MILHAGMVAAAASLLAAPASAGALFDDFQRICVATGANATASAEIADGAGWRAMPEGLLKGFEQDGMKVVNARMNVVDRQLNLLINAAGEQRAGGETLKIRMCAVAARPADAASVQKEVADWTGVEPDGRFSRGAGEVYAFTEDARGRRSLGRRSGSALKRLVAADKLKFLFFRSDETTVMVGLGIPEL